MTKAEIVEQIYERVGFSKKEAAELVEKVFDIPGMGKYAFEGLLRRDFYIVMAVTIFVGIMTQVGILLSDITYSLVDPRIRHE